MNLATLTKGKGLKPSGMKAHITEQRGETKQLLITITTY